MDFVEFSDVMNFLTGGANPIATPEQIAVHMSRGIDSIYSYRAGRTHPDIDSVRQLHEWLVKEHGCYVILRYLNPFSEGTANGHVQDDLWNLHEQSTDLARYHEQMKKGCHEARQKYFDTLSLMKGEIKDLEAEGLQAEGGL